MCNEFRFKQSLDTLADEFSQLRLPLHWAGGAPNLEPRDSIRPTDPAAVITGAAEGAELHWLRWGFAPAQGRGGPVINFRSDGRRFPSGRCLVPIDGSYEFTGAKSPKSKWLFTAADPALGTDFFCVAGLMRDDRFTLLTCPPGPDIAPYHDRQIVILPRDQWSPWLNRDAETPPIAPLPAGSLAVTRIR